MSPSVRDNPDESRYEIRVDGDGADSADGADVAGFAEYHLHENVMAFLHTEIDRSHQGEGLAKVLIGAALDDAKRRGFTVQPFCPFVRNYIKDNRGYAELVSPDDWVRFGLTF